MIYIKKILALFFATLMISFNTDAKNIKIIRKGSADGIHYDRVSESHNWFTTKLSCLGSGNIQCSWVNQPSIGNTTADYVENWVMMQIELGREYGAGVYDSHINVEWSYDSRTKDLIIDMDDGLD